MCKNVKATLLYIDFSKAFDSIHKGKIEQILRAYGLPKETLTTLIILYKNTNAMFHSPNGDTNLFDIVPGVFQRDTLSPYMFII